MHRSAPKIVEENVYQRRVWSEISVIFDSTNIVKNKPAITTVMVANDASENHHRPQGMFEGHRATRTENTLQKSKQNSSTDRRRHSHLRNQKTNLTGSQRPSLIRTALAKLKMTKQKSRAARLGLFSGRPGF